MKAHVQHAVGLVEHQGFEFAQIQALAVQVVHHAARGAHHNVRAMFQAGQLSAQRHTAAQGDQLDVVLRARQAPNFSGHLVGQFARGAQHHGLHGKQAGVQAVQQRQAKGSGFAAAGFGLGDHILAQQGRGEGRRLNGRHGLVAQLLQVGQDLGRQAQAGKCGVLCRGRVH